MTEYLFLLTMLFRCPRASFDSIEYKDRVLGTVNECSYTNLRYDTHFATIHCPFAELSCPTVAITAKRLRPCPIAAEENNGTCKPVE
jgi:hypothetical protein